MRRMNPLLLLLALLVVLAPASAHATLKIAGGRPDRAQRETPPRKGIYLGANVRPGAAGMMNTFIPVVRGEYEVGGGITDRFTLGVAVGGTGYLGLSKGSFDANIVAHRFFGKGLFVRGMAGVASRSPALDRASMMPALGGSLGLGYEFRVFERVGLGLGADYDVRLRIDGHVAQTWLFGLRFTGYLDKKKRY
jgi:hypothetical protein